MKTAWIAYFAAYFAEHSRRCIYCDGHVRAGGWSDTGWDYVLGMDMLRQAHARCHREACR